MLASLIPFLLAVTLVAGCLPGAFDELRGDGPMDVASDAGMDASADEDASTVVEDAAVPDASEPDAGPQTMSFMLTSDSDDGIFCQISGQLDEKLHFSVNEGAAGNTIEVGVDSEQCRTGLRFELPLAPGSRVESAVIRLYRVGPEDNVASDATMRVQVYEGSMVGPFDDVHQHDMPAQHGSEGVWSTSVGGWQVGPTESFTESPDVSSLVQHVLDGDSWQADAAVTFLISPDMMTDNQYAQFRDSAGNVQQPLLTLTYR